MAHGPDLSPQRLSEGQSSGGGGWESKLILFPFPLGVEARTRNGRQGFHFMLLTWRSCSASLGSVINCIWLTACGLYVDRW